MYLMYVDEAGDLATLGSPAAPNDQPVFILGGLLVAADSIRSFTIAYLAAKRRFFPELSSSKHHFDWMLAEVKGTSLKKSALAPSRNQRRHARLFLGRILGIVEDHGGRLLARVWIKEPRAFIRHASVYTYSVQSLCFAFDRYMEESDSRGMCIADFRTQGLNSKVAHSLFTQQYGFSERYRRLEEVPVFGDSNNHAGLQVCDIIVSAILMPIACKAYCDKHVRNVHVQSNALELRELYGERIRALQYRYNKTGTSRFTGGISVSDPIGKRDGSLMFSGQGDLARTSTGQG